jgi:hypothetical protein
MRRIVVVSLGLLAAASLNACSKKPGVPDKPNSPKPVVEAAAPDKPLSAAAMPHRKPGLWAQTMTTSRGMSQETKLCVGPDTESKLTPWGQAMGKSLCSRNAVSRTLTGWKFESECDMGEGHISSHGEATGDFDGGYSMKITSVTSGSSMAQANGTHEMTLQAKYEGACPADMKSGDMTMNMPGMKGGMKINVEQMAAMRK